MKKENSFTLVEVMISACIIAVFSVFIYQAFLISLNANSYVNNKLNAGLLANNKAWEFCENFSRADNPSSLIKSGNATLGDKGYSWSINAPLQCALCRVEILLYWLENGKTVRFSNTFYVLK